MMSLLRIGSRKVTDKFFLSLTHGDKVLIMQVLDSVNSSINLQLEK